MIAMRTVGEVISSVLPSGTVPRKFQEVQEARGGADISDDEARYGNPPMLPTDLFAAVAYLAKVSGLVAFFDPSPYCQDFSDCRFCLTTAERGKLDEAGAAWRKRENKGVPPPLVRELWQQLRRDWSKPIAPGNYMKNGGHAPDWWRAALKLIVVSDMALNRLLRDPLSRNPKTGGDYDGIFWEEQIRNLYRQKDGDGKQKPPPASLTMMVDTTVACVLPKVRVAAVGATLRNLSRNISLLPGRGEVRCYWDLSVEAPPSEDDETLDILLIPAPLELAAGCFVPNTDDGISKKDLRYYKKDWENFDIRQVWIDGKPARECFVQDCIALVKEAQRETNCVNGIILPEYAVDSELFEELCESLKRVEPGLEFVVAGSRTNCDGKEANHVLTRVWYDHAKASMHITNSRSKHHRWRLDRSQVETYSLSAALNPKIKNWWENTPLGRREIHFQRFREKSVFSVLICEELARSDPCHDILRSVAPNLIFALLLDGPQIKERWPAQYASNLADDPGSSVLSFTSYGLIDRSNKQGRYKENHSIAMWKDDAGNFLSIAMPSGKGMRGVLLSLWSEHVYDMTLAGKQSQARAWRYSSHMPIVPNR